jgi:TP901 family phage tail tape measure protein
MAGGLFRPMLQLETTMAELAVKGGLNRAQSSDVERVVRSVGKSSGFGAVAAGQAGVELAAAGITGVSDLSSAIPTTLRLARADKSLGGTGAAASTLVQTASQFGLTATAFESIGDKMVKAADSSTVSVRDLSESLTEIGAVSHGAGISLEETLGTLALLGKAGGIEGSKAGTGLKAVVSNLVKPTRQTLGGLASVGITEKQAQNALQDLPAFFKMLNDKMDARKMTAAQRAKVMFTIFKQEGASAANTLSQNTEAWRQMTREVSGADGQLATVSEALESTTEGALMRFRAAVDDAKISLADRLAPTLTRTLPDATRIATGAIGLIGDNLTAISVIGGTVGAAWSVSMLASAGTALATGFTAIGGSATMLTAATAAGTTFGATFAASMMAAVAGYAGVTALLGVTEDAQGNNAMHRLGARYSDLFAGRESAPVATHRGLTAGAPGAVDPMTSDLPGMSAGAGYSEEQRATIFVRVDDDGKPRLRTESRGKVALKLGANPGGIGKFE